jgi:hypothetical protein
MPAGSQISYREVDTVRIGLLTRKKAICSVLVVFPLDQRHLEQLEQTVRFQYSNTMALPSGIYTVQNVKYRNWAMLLNANEGEVIAGISATTNVGEKVSLMKT